jgi:hypothetical protein
MIREFDSNFSSCCTRELNHLIPGEVLSFDPPIAVDLTGRQRISDLPPVIFMNLSFESDLKSYGEKSNGCRQSGYEFP